MRQVMMETTSGFKTHAGIEDGNGTTIITIQNVRSAFGPGNLGNVYVLRVVQGDELQLTDVFNIRNAGRNYADCGDWKVIPDVPGANFTLWDASYVSQDMPERKRAPKPASRPASPQNAVPSVLNGLVIGSARIPISSQV